MVVGSCECSQNSFSGVQDSGADARGTLAGTSNQNFQLSTFNSNVSQRRKQDVKLIKKDDKTHRSVKNVDLAFDAKSTFSYIQKNKFRDSRGHGRWDGGRIGGCG